MDDTTTTTLKRRNSVPSAVIIPTKHTINGHHHHHHHNHQSPAVKLPVGDFELIYLPPGSYTSLKDLIPASPSSILSPTPTAAAVSSSPSTGEISIRNRLVKQAAWAYLQSSVASSDPSSTRRLCFSGEFVRSLFAGFRQLVIHNVTRAYEWLVDALWLLLCR